MEKRLRSSLRTSAEEFLSSAAESGLTKSTKSSLKALIYNISPSSDLKSSLPTALHAAISQSIDRFKSDSIRPSSPQTPPAKRRRRSSRNRQNDDVPFPTTENVFESLQVYAHIAVLCLSHPKSAFSATDMYQGVLNLHDNLVLFESDPTLLSEIANLCEEWWKRDLSGKETLISQSLPFLLSRSLTSKKKVDVHKVYTLREAFMLFDFEDESIEDLKNLLIRCVVSPMYFKTDEGKKFVAFMFGFSDQLVKETLAMIKSQVQFGKKSMLEAYGEVVFRAWKSVEGESKDSIENGFLQGMIDSAVHASSREFAASIRRLLGGFITQRTTEGVEKLLFRLAEPVIFRSLQVANSNVRQNALHLLLDLFPLGDPDATKEAEDALLQRQFYLLEKLLMDDCPDVRVVAVEGGCRILNLFWEVIPSAAITKTLTKIFDDLTHDTVTEVRLSTVRGIMYLLGNPHSHEILKVLLPRMGHLMLDIAQSVRSALLDLLILSVDIRNFQFHKVATLDLLLNVLANDHPHLGHKITKLLIPSYFPSRVTPEEACNRCIALIKRSPVAGARFCEFLVSEEASLESLMELFSVIISVSLSSDKCDVEYRDGLISAASHICDHLVNDSSKRNSVKEILTVDKLKRLFLVASNAHAKSHVCRIVTAVSPSVVGGLLKECLGLIMNCSGISDNMDLQNEIRSAHKMVVSCDWFDQMFGAMAKHLQETAQLCHERFGIQLPKCADASAKRGKIKSTYRTSSKSDNSAGRRSSSTLENKLEKSYAITAGIAWQIKELLLSESARKALLRSKNLDAAFSSLKVLAEVSILQCLQFSIMRASVVSAYAGLALNMSLRHASLKDSMKSSARKRDRKDASDSSPESISWETILCSSTGHLLKCTEQLFRTRACENCGEMLSVLPEAREKCHSCVHEKADNQSGPSNNGGSYDEPSRISNMLKVLTAVLKFIVDAATVEVGFYNPEMCLKFAIQYVKFVISNLRNCHRNQLEFMEQDLTETVYCLKSSFTYAAKLLSSYLKSSSVDSIPLPSVRQLTNELLNLIPSVEEYLGRGQATRLVTAAKPWVPDLILALGSWHLLKQTLPESASDDLKSPLPSWAAVLAKIELSEIQDTASDGETVRASKSERFSGFKKLMDVMVKLLKANPEVLDVVGATFLKGSLIGLERKDFDLVFGLVHFVCLKLARGEDWINLKLMLESVRMMCPKLDLEVKQSSNTEDEREMVNSAMALLEPVWMQHFSGVEEN